MMATTQTSLSQPPPKLLTIEEYASLPENDRREELVQGRIVELTSPKPRHGLVCVNITYELRQHVKAHDLGRVFINDTGVITQRDPDTLRGADVVYWSYERLPRGPMSSSYIEAAPELVYEVLSPEDRRSRVLAKVAEYLEAGVIAVCVVDADRRVVTVYRADQPEQTLVEERTLAVPEVLPQWQVPIEQIFADL